MITQTRQYILEYIKKRGRVRAHNLKQELQLSGVAIHKQLKKLLQEDKIIKKGTPPYVFYSLLSKKEKRTQMGTEQIAEIITPILLKYGVKKASLFGSYARGDYDENSDIDVLIEPPSTMGLTFIDLHQSLEDALHKKVDLVSYNGISKYLKKHILANKISFL